MGEGFAGRSNSTDTLDIHAILYFALRSGGEHRQLRLHSSQIELIEKSAEKGHALNILKTFQRTDLVALREERLNPRWCIIMPTLLGQSDVLYNSIRSISSYAHLVQNQIHFTCSHLKIQCQHAGIQENQ